MKKPLTILTLLLCAIFPSTSFAEWKIVSKGDATDFYIDFERIRNVDGYVYYWELGDYAKPMTDMMLLSSKRYIQADCKLFRYKVLTYVYHKQPMGRDSGETSEPTNNDWRYPPPSTIMENMLTEACNY